MAGPDLSRREALLAGAAGLAGAALPVSARASAPPLDGWEPDGLSGSFAVSNATVVLHTGQRLEGAGLAVENGVVVEVGPGVTGGTDLGGRWVVPGFTDAGCQVGLFEIGMEQSSHDRGASLDAIQPDARVWEGFNPRSEVLAVTRAAGVTQVLLHPDLDRLVPGQAGLMRTVGRTRAEALLQAPSALVIGLGRSGAGGGGPTSRVGISMKLRELFFEHRVEDEGDPPRGRRRRRQTDEAAGEDRTPAEAVLHRVLRGEQKVLFKAERADDCLLACALAEEHGLDAALLGGAEAWLVASELADAGMPVLLGNLTVQPDSFEHLHARYENAALLHEAGVKLAFRTGSNHFSRGLATNAGVAVAHGLPWEAAIQALTGAAGDILGVSQLGRLEPGSPATFFVSDGDPLQPRHRVRQVFIDGRETSMHNRQRRLYERYKTLW